MTREEFIKDRLLVYLKKDKDYGNSADRTCELFGDVAYAVRIHDKLARIQQLLQSDAEVSESIEDTILDFVNYLVMYDTYDCENRLVAIVESLTKIYDKSHDYIYDVVYWLKKETTGDTPIIEDESKIFKYIADYITAL